MKMSDAFFITRREYPKDEKMISSKLLIKSGMILKNENGVYSYLPFGFKVIKNIENVIRCEFKNINACEVLMPSLVSTSTFETTNRKNIFDKEMFNFLNRDNKQYSLTPTSEELFTYLARNKIRSYKDLHFTLFQISNKYRDEEKTELGLIRKKEFLMADAYSFDAGDSASDVSYDKMYLSFMKIFDKLGLSTVIVRSDPYYMKGLSSEEFQVVSEYGDNEIVKCSNCNFSSNIEDAACKNNYKYEDVKLKKMELVKTPNVKSIKDISKYLKVSEDNIIKSLVVKIDDEYKMILLRGNSELNVNKLKRLLNVDNIVIPSSYELEKIGTSVGFIGPIKATMQVIADLEVKNMLNAVCGSNKKDYHYINVVPGRDFRVNRYSDIKLFDSNSLCPKCKNKCKILRGIEVGHIFKLGSNYSKYYQLKYINELNTHEYVNMCSYGIGIDRCMQAIVEKNHDDKGIIWPISVAPFKVAIVIANVNEKESSKYAFNLYDKLSSLNIDTLIDDRKESVGVKFADIDLIGIPIRVTVGRGYEDGVVELKLRKKDNTDFIKLENIVDKIKELIENYNKEL